MSAEACQREAARALLTGGVPMSVEEVPAMEKLIPTSPAPNLGAIPGMCPRVLTKPVTPVAAGHEKRRVFREIPPQAILYLQT